MSDSFMADLGDEVCRAETAGRVVRGSLRPWGRRVVRMVGMKLILVDDGVVCSCCVWWMLLVWSIQERRYIYIYIY